MTKRFDVCAPRPGKEKTFWHRVGTAFENEKGISIVFDSLPLPDKDGRVSVLLFEAKPKDGKPREAKSPAADMDDEIPF
jgi:hypothetical protein